MIFVEPYDFFSEIIGTRCHSLILPDEFPYTQVKTDLMALLVAQFMMVLLLVRQPKRRWTMSSRLTSEILAAFTRRWLQASLSPKNGTFKFSS